ncbi:MAG: ATP-binding protein, partial [Treponema sp.]|nr:ATP-binding protein [Treponema sp.]
SVKGYLIDKQGVIRSDNTAHDTGSDVTRINDEYPDAAFTRTLTAYLNQINGFFTGDTKPEVLRLGSGPYEYAAIEPIQNTDWSIVAFCNSGTLSGTGSFFLLLIAMLAMLFLYVVFRNTLMSRMIFIPMKQLAQSVSAGMCDEGVYGSDRDDEIGELARTIQNTGRENQSQTKRLNAATAKLEAVIANYPGIIWCVDQDNMITLFNGRYLGELGLLPESFEGKKVSEALHDDRFSAITSNIQKTFSQGPQDINTEIGGKMYRIRTTPLYDGAGVVITIVGSFDDITERTRLQNELKTALTAAQEASDAKTDFLANMSHEMRTPLNAIIGLSELTLSSEDLDPAGFTNLEKINSAGMTLLSTVNDILDISKIEAGKFELVPVDFDLPSMLNDVITQSIMYTGEKPIVFIPDINENLPSRVYGDDLRIRQILNNLLSNAFKYTQKGEVVLALNFTPEDDSIWLIADVRDTGIGIKPEDIKKLFSDYIKLDTRINRGIEGAGLGLPITKKLVELMGGSISVTSEYGKGSVFTVRMKLKITDAAIIGAQAVSNLRKFNYTEEKRGKNVRMPRPNMSYARVLVADDVPTNLDVFKGMMKPYKINVDCVSGGQEAVDAIKNDKIRYNAVFMDHMMPGIDGIKATKMIREEIGTEYAKNIPIIALTANALVGNETMYLAKGFQAFISKPIDMERLDTVIKEWVRDKEKENKAGVPGSGNYKDEASRKELIQRTITRRRSGIDRRGLAKQIPGIDVINGIKRIGGNLLVYVKILHAYAVNTRELLKKIETVDANSLKDYIIIVHGIKGSSYSLFADDIGRQAETLEKAANAGDLAAVESMNPSFLESAEKLLTNIITVIGKTGETASRPAKSKPDEKLLELLLEACTQYRINTADDIINDIEEYRYYADDGLAVWLRENADQSNFEEIIARLRKILSNSGKNTHNNGQEGMNGDTPQ